MAAIQDLTNLINQVVQEKTFTADALAGIQQIKERAEFLQNELNDTRKKLETTTNLANDYKARENSLSVKASDLDVREKTLNERERKITELERDTAVAKAELRLLDRVFDRLFANRQVRETLTSSVPIERQYSGGGGSFVEHHTKTDEVVREER